MRFKIQPEDFVVEELAQLPLAPEGGLAIYRVEKRNVTTLQVQTDIAAQLHRRSADVTSPALKDKRSAAIQFLCVRGAGPGKLEGPGYRASLVGRSHRPLRPSDLTGNRFSVILRDISPTEAGRLDERLSAVARHGLPNYFDEQRFGSYSLLGDTPDRFIGKTILRRDAEGAVRAYLAHPFLGDPSSVRAFKAVARQHWREWAYLLENAPRPSNYRSLLTYLKDHPQGYRKALNLIPRRLLSLYLAAYQSYLWNKIAGGYLKGVLSTNAPMPALTVLDLALPVYRVLSSAQHASLSATSVPLPGHRAVYSDPELAGVVGEVLAAEGIGLGDLKARILQRAYLSKGQRRLLLHPADIGSDVVQDDDRFSGSQARRVSFTLPPGAFATLVLKWLELADDIQSSQPLESGVRTPVMALAKGATATEILPEA
jgi:tRNA pseudouridine13 synthase